MAANDRVVVDGIVDGLLGERPDLDRGSAFELFSLQQVLKPFDLSADDLDSGWVDGSDDGGIDGFFAFVDGKPTTPIGAANARRNAVLDLVIVTCKHRDSFQQIPLNNLVASVGELLDFSKRTAELVGQYSAEVQDARERFINLYRTLAIRQPQLRIRYVYASRGDTREIATNVRARADQLLELTRQLFSACEVLFSFLGPTELVEESRRVRLFTLRLPFLEVLSHGGSNYVVLCTIADYARFVTDDDGSLRRYLFDSNVRDYAGDNRVNTSIVATLEEPARSADFWWLNNGITILVSQATVAGKEITLDTVQIVNGLQTTETIFNHRSRTTSDDHRSVLLKIISTTDDVVRDSIIRATNHQTAVQSAALHATEKIQRDIESVLERNGWYYERRTHYYKNVGKPANRIITPLGLAAAYVALVLKDPGVAAGLKNRVVTNEHTYNLIFSEAADLALYPKSAALVGRVNEILLSAPTDELFRRYLGKWRLVIAFLVVGKVLGRLSYSGQRLLQCSPETISADHVREACVLIDTQVGKLPKGMTPKALARLFQNDGFVRGCVRLYSEANALESGSSVCNSEVMDRRLSDGFIRRVDDQLPRQPWRRNVHYGVASQMGASPDLVQRAIGKLIDTGRRYRQVDGVMYLPDGAVVARADQD